MESLPLELLVRILDMLDIGETATHRVSTTWRWATEEVVRGRRVSVEDVSAAIRRMPRPIDDIRWLFRGAGMQSPTALRRIYNHYIREGYDPRPAFNTITLSRLAHRRLSDYEGNETMLSRVVAGMDSVLATELAKTGHEARRGLARDFYIQYMNRDDLPWKPIADMMIACHDYHVIPRNDEMAVYIAKAAYREAEETPDDATAFSIIMDVMFLTNNAPGKAHDEDDSLQGLRMPLNLLIRLCRDTERMEAITDSYFFEPEFVFYMLPVYNKETFPACLRACLGPTDFGPDGKLTPSLLDALQSCYVYNDEAFKQLELVRK